MHQCPSSGSTKSQTLAAVSSILIDDFDVSPLLFCPMRPDKISQSVNVDNVADCPIHAAVLVGMKIATLCESGWNRVRLVLIGLAKLERATEHKADNARNHSKLHGSNEKEVSYRQPERAELEVKRF